LRNTIKTTSGHSEQNAGNAAIWGTRSAPPWQCASAYSFLY
jgi:hypothetical protein